MNNRTAHYRLIAGILIAHVLMFFSFQNRVVFWYIFAGSILLLITYAMFQGDVDDEVPFFTYISLGIISGLIVYCFFWLSNQGIHLFHLPFDQSIKRLYHYFAPSLYWEYFALILIAAPGEELFWRGFVQKKLLRSFKPSVAIIISSCLYASTQIYSGEFILVLTTFLCGLAWGSLYFWKKSMPTLIASHIVFDILLFIILPLK